MLDDLRALVADLVRDDVERVGSAQGDRAINAAVIQYTKDRPRRSVEDVVSEGGSWLPLPEGALRVVQVETPPDQVPPRILPARAWGHYTAPLGVRILLTQPLAADTAVRLTVTRPHVLTDAEDTLPEEDREAVASYAAAVLLDQIATATSGASTPTIPADTVDHGSKPTNFASRATTLRQHYHDLLGIDPKRQRPASAVATQPLAPSYGGAGRLTHRRWGR